VRWREYPCDGEYRVVKLQMSVKVSARMSLEMSGMLWMFSTQMEKFEMIKISAGEETSK
jgi:hypothetical protein